MAGAKKLVIGASGLRGCDVTRQLVDRGDDVRVLIRRTSSTKAIEDLDVDYHYGDIFDDAAVRTVMAGCDDVFTASSTRGRGCGTRRRCFAPTSMACVMSWTPRWTPT